MDNNNLNAQTPFNPEYEQFIAENPGRGRLRIQISAADDAFPVSGVTAEVALEYNGQRFLLYKDVTDSSGIIENIVLPARAASESQNPETADGCETDYLISVYRPGFEELTDLPVTVHDKTETILPIELCPQGLREG